MVISRQGLLIWLIAALGLLLSACKPVANAINVETLIDTPVAIMLSGSDMDGDALTFRVISQPGNGSLSGESPNLVYTPETGFIGTDQFEYVANDGKDDSTPKLVTILVKPSNHPPVPVVDKRLKIISVGETVQIDASNSFDLEGDAISYSWSVASAPEAGVAQELVTDEPILEFTPVEKGHYTMELQVSDDFGTSHVLEVSLLTDAYEFHGLDFAVTDAEQDSVNNRIVFVSADAPALHVYDMNTHQVSSVDLPYVPTSVAVAASGAAAVVGHNGYISHISLQSMAMINTFPVTIDVSDVVMTNGMAVLMPRVDQWVSLYSVDLATGVQTAGTGRSVRANTKMKLHPSGSYAYGADRGLSPSDIEKYDVSSSPVAYLYDSPYHGDYGMCGDLWMDANGQRIFTACGNVFSSSDSQEQDMRYIGKLDGQTSLRWVSTMADDIYAIGNTDTQVTLFDSQFLNQKAAYSLPKVSVGGSLYPTHGHFVFPNSNGISHSVVVKVDPGAGLLYDWGVADFAPDALGSVLPVAAIDGNASTTIGSEIELNGTGSHPGSGNQLSYFWHVVSAPNGGAVSPQDKTSATLHFNADLAGEYGVVLVVYDGEKYSDAAYFNVQVVDTSAAYNVPLEYSILDAEYNEAIDKLVMVSASPDQLIVFDPITLEQQIVALPLTPTAVGTSLDGATAVVGHNGWITQVDLSAGNIIDQFNTSADVFDIVVTHGYAHAMPRVDQWEKIRSIDLSTGVETLQSGYSVRAGTVMKLHPSGDYAYGADRGLSPSDIEKYDLSLGTASMMYDSPYHGDYAMCGNLWIGEDGLRIITGCGNIFRSSADEALDMTYNGSLSGVSAIRWVSHSMEQDQMMVLHSGNRVATFQYSNTLMLEDEELPEVQLGGDSYSTEGEFAFFNSAGDRRIFVLKALQSGTNNSYSVYVE